MATLRLVASQGETNRKANTGHRMSASEGEAASRLLDQEGFTEKGPINSRERASQCPFHDEPGPVPRGANPHFYLNKQSGLFTCFSASCGEKGNLRALERHFGIDVEDGWVDAIKTKDQQLTLFEMDLTHELRKPFYEHGLTDHTIERFRLGWDRENGRYVIPYLSGRRPKFFRYYQPDGPAKYKYTWELGAEAGLFNPQDAMGDKDGLVVLTESEQKAMLLVQMGYSAVGVPGAGIWRSEWMSLFTHARKIVVLFDNDSPEHHIYDRPDKGQKCQKCRGQGLERCIGHNPGQDAALARVEQLGWRARNAVMPIPDGQAKTDVNDYVMRDGASVEDLRALITGKAVSNFRVASFAEIMENPPEQVAFLVEQGILPAGGRLLLSGAPKAGKSIAVENLALSLTSGIPFLGKFGVDHPTRTLLLDRELSKRSLFDRLSILIEARPGYRAGLDNLLIDHDHLIRLDMPNSKETLIELVESNGAEVVILDTAYKFFAGDVESSKSLMSAFAVLDSVIAETGCAFVLTHHLKKMQNNGKGQAQDVADPDRVAGSFLWTGWPNATILLNFIERSVENPYNVSASFVAFRDAAPPEPLALYRSRESIAYTAIEPYQHGAETGYDAPATPARVSTDVITNLLMDMCPITEEAFLHAAGARFGGAKVVRPYLLDALASGAFSKTGRPAVIRFRYDKEEESWDQEHAVQGREMRLV